MPKNRLSTGAHQIWWAPGYRLNLEKKPSQSFRRKEVRKRLSHWPFSGIYELQLKVELDRCTFCWFASFVSPRYPPLPSPPLPSPPLPSRSVSTHCFLPINWMKAYAPVCSCDGVSKREFVPLDQVSPLLVLNCFLLLRENKISSLLWAPGRFTLFSTIRIVLDCF